MVVPQLRPVPSSSEQFDDRWGDVERTRTAFLISLRVIIHALQEFAQRCKFPISKGFSFP